MNKRSFRRRVSQSVAVLLAHALVFTSMPVDAAPRAQKPPVAPAVRPEGKTPASAPSAPPRVTVKRTLPSFAPPSSTPTFSSPPTVAEIFRARIFAEPFLPVGGEPTSVETAALASAIKEYLRGKDAEDVSAFGTFLNDHPTSPWRASILTNLGAHYKSTGYFTKATDVLREGWDLAKGQAGRAAGATADRALSELLGLHMQFGRVDAIEALVAESAERDFHGGVTEQVLQAKAAIYTLRNAHHEAIASAAVSVDQLQGYGKKGHFQHPEVSRHLASHDGASLADVGDLAQRAGVQLRLARRTTGDFVPGSIIHLKSGHFSALVRQEGDRFLLADPMLHQSGELWMTRAALEDESSGFALLPAAAQPEGWTATARQVVAGVRGKCIAAGPNAGATASNGSSPNLTCSTGNCSAMAVYSFHSLLINLSIRDTPVRYSPPRGPWIGFELIYNHREAFQPTTFTYVNMGPRWNFDWLSYVTDTPANLTGPAKIFLRGGGSEDLSGFAGDRYLPATRSRGVLVRTSTDPIRYQRELPDGSLEIFAAADTGVSPRRVFMTEWRDPAGNAAQIAYDAQFRIVAITDAIGQVTTLEYGIESDPLKITKVTDPFGRAATFEYNSTGALVKITDVIGITSEFGYGLADFIRTLTTPYGTTVFAHGTTQGDTGTYYPNVWLEATDPLGGKERVERIWNLTAMATTDPPNLVPQGFEAFNNGGLHSRNTFYWDKRAMALYPGDYTKARIMKWLWGYGSTMSLSDFMHSEKMPLENRVWYAQMGAMASDASGPDGRPAKVGRVLDDGTSQIYRYEYNLKGLPTRKTDPLGRETVYEYDTNEIDMRRVKQKNSASTGGYDIRQSSTYNTQGLPLTTTNAAGQTTTYTYNAQGQILTVTTPPRVGITEDRTTTYGYDINGRLETVTRPAAGAVTSFTYDGHGRMHTTTDSDGYTLTRDYDTLDRPTRVTYPDDTYEETTYARLDPENRRDRLGRWTHTFHDALRRVVSVRDAAGRMTTQQWCSCGSLDRLLDAKGNATAWERDLQGRVTREIRVDGSAWEYTYETTTSRARKVKDAQNQEIQYSYFLDDKLQQISYVNAQIATPNVSFTYDASHGRLLTVADGTGTTTYAYHPIAAPPALGAGQIASVDSPLPNDTISYTYDELGRAVSRTVNGVTATWAFDAVGRVTTISDPIGSFIYQYVGPTGRVSNVIYPNAQTTVYAYLPVNQDLRLQEIHHKQAGGATLNKFNYTYDAVGNILTWAQQTDTNPTQSYTYEYDRADQLGAATLAASTPKRYRYVYDPAGNRSVEQIDDAGTLSTYDSMNRLASQVPGGGLSFRGTVSEPATVSVGGQPATVSVTNQFGAMAQVPSGTSSVNVQATDSSGNVRTNVYQLTQTGASKSFTYDPNGNLTSDGVKTYFWDAANRLVQVKQGTTTLAAFTYDGEGRRATKVAGGVTISYIYDGLQFLEERPSVGSAKRYVYGLGIDRPLAQVMAGTTKYYVADHLGSIIRTTDTAGSPTLTRQYDPWGNPLQGAGTSGYAFTGREWEPEVGLYYYRARYYDASIGRFNSGDPIGLKAGSNLFTYVSNNPVNYTDPRGLAAVPAGSCASCPGGKWSGAGVNWGGQPGAYAAYTGIYKVCCWSTKVCCTIMTEYLGMGLGLGGSVSVESIWIWNAPSSCSLGGTTCGGAASGGAGVVGTGATIGVNCGRVMVQNPSTSGGATAGVGIGGGGGATGGVTTTTVLSCTCP